VNSLAVMELQHRPKLNLNRKYIGYYAQIFAVDIDKLRQLEISN
jgi:hypothetical protein